MTARTRLLGAREAAVSRGAALRKELRDILDSASSTTGDDEHDPEGATIGFERAQAAALLAGAEEQVREVDAALGRLSDGTYTDCVDCGRSIGAERLTARPTANRCVSCASRRR